MNDHEMNLIEMNVALYRIYTSVVNTIWHCVDNITL